MWVGINGAVKIDLELSSRRFSRVRKANWTNENAFLRPNILKKSGKLVDTLNINPTLIILTVNHDVNFVLANFFTDENVNLSLDTRSTPGKFHVV